MKIIILSVVITINLVCPAAFFGQTLFWSVNSQEALLKGHSEGVVIDDAGKISLAPALFGMYDAGEQFVWSSAVGAGGTVYIGTGGNGKIFSVNNDGSGSLLYDSDEINVSALAVASDGALFAATSPDGKVYRIDRNGNATVYFEPKTKYIWSLAIAKDGTLLVGTGETGRIFRVAKSGAVPDSSVLYDSRETHIICLSVDPAGNIYAGTDSSGLVLKIDPSGKAFAVLDSPLREIHEISVGRDGSIYVLALSESASVKSPEVSDATAETDDTVKVDRPDPATPPASPVPAKSRYDLTGSKSAVYKIGPGTSSDVIWNSDTVTAFSVQAEPQGGGVLIGTSDRGRIFKVSDSSRESLLIQTDEEQISTLKTSGSHIVATTSSKGRVFRFGTATVTEGSYSSAVLDAQAISSWGRIWSQKQGTVSIETRSGNSARPGETWSSWAPVGAAGDISSPAARFIQWKALLKGGTSAALAESTLSFVQANIAPEILSIEVLPPNVGLAANPEIQIDPNIETLGLNPVDFGIAVAAAPPRRVFQSGARGIQWVGSDRNGDSLRYRIYLSKFGSGVFAPMGDSTLSTFFTLDGLALEEGRYVVKIVAEDSPSNKESSSRSGQRISEPFDIDNSPPVVTLAGTPVRSADDLVLTFLASESSSYINRAEYRVNGGRWIPAFADDGIADGKSEKFTIRANVSGLADFVVTIRVLDAVGNIGSARYSGK